MSVRLGFLAPPHPSLQLVGALPVYWLRATEPLAHFIAVWDAPALPNFPAGTRALLLRLLAAENARYPAGGLAQRLKRLGWTFEWHSSLDSIWLSASGLVENLPAALELLHLMVEAPLLRGPDVAKHRSRLIESHIRAWANPAYRADSYVAQGLWGDTYAVMEGASPAALQKVGEAELGAYHEGFLWRGLRAVVLVAPTLPKSLTPWQIWVRPLRYALRLPWEKEPTIQVEETPEAQQASLRWAYPWRRALSPSDVWYALAVLRLGGYFGSQLMRTIREEAGLTYGIYARAEETQAGSYLIIRTEVARSRAAEAVARIQEEVQRWATQPFPTMEIWEEARNYLLVQRTPETLREWASWIAGALMRRRPIELYYAQMETLAQATWPHIPSLLLPDEPFLQVGVGVEKGIFAGACV